MNHKLEQTLLTSSDAVLSYHLGIPAFTNTLKSIEKSYIAITF